MSKKTMTIHQFMDMKRIKDFNQNRGIKKSKIYLLLTLLILTGTLIITTVSTETAITAFKLTAINF